MMSIAGIALIVCLCLTSMILGMVLMAIILHPYRKELKRAKKSEAAWQLYQQQVRNLNR
jgi:peptidoglycan/LPS O-acetylase OafA/YrhL